MSAIIYFCKIFNIFHKNYLVKPIVISPPINSVLPIAKPITKPLIDVSKRK